MKDLTPRQHAYATAIDALYAEHKNYQGKDGRSRAIRSQLAKLHNTLLERSKLDGLNIDENE